MPDMITAVSDTVARALRDGEPVVALESTIITHGLPRPDNLRAAREFEATVREHGGIPATIAVLDGVAHVGLEDEQLERLAAGGADALKLSVRDLPVAAAQRTTGGTTVAATAWLAAREGIRCFATGGMGGVHRGAHTTFDESADLGVLAATPITLVCAGVKSILDIPATLERLETLSVPVLVYRSRRFPAFWLTDSGHEVDHSVDSVDQIAAIMRSSDELGRTGGILVANPLPLDEQLDPDLHDRLLADALAAAVERRITGKAVTPFLLEYVHEHTGRRSVEVNLEIVRGNCRLASAIARAFVTGAAPAPTATGPTAPAAAA